MEQSPAKPVPSMFNQTNLKEDASDGRRDDTPTRDTSEIPVDSRNFQSRSIVERIRCETCKLELGANQKNVLSRVHFLKRNLDIDGFPFHVHLECRWLVVSLSVVLLAFPLKPHKKGTWRVFFFGTTQISRTEIELIPEPNPKTIRKRPKRCGCAASK